MIGFEAVPGGVPRAQADLLVLPCYAGPGFPSRAGPRRGRGGGRARHRPRPRRSARTDSPAQVGDTFATLSLGRLGAGSVLFVGLGSREQAGPGAVRQAAMLAAAHLAAAVRVAATLPDSGWPDTRSRGRGGVRRGAAARGLPVRQVPAGPGHARLAPPGARARRGADGRLRIRRRWPLGLRRGERLAGLTNWVRDLVNASPSDTTPDDLAAEARLLADGHGLTCSVLTVPELAAGGFGGILGVGQGSRNEPRLVELAYRGGGDGPVIGLTGKGITFDSGGLNLKRTSEIEWMKSDMAGAATIMAVLRGRRRVRPAGQHRRRAAVRREHAGRRRAAAR